MTSHAIISGGSSGIGLALARRLAGQGWNVTLLARSMERLEAARAEIEQGAPESVVRVISADVQDEGAVQSAMQTAIAASGPPDLVVTSAGIVIPGRFSELPAKAFQDTMKVNYFGSLHVVRAALPAMRTRRAKEGRGSRIVLVSSGAGLIGLYGYTAYAPTKFAVRGLAEALRAELKPEGIAVSIVYPPDTDTPQLQEEIRIRPEATSRIAAGARVHSADEVADAILAGIRRGRFTIAPGWEMGVLARLHSLIAPLLNRFSFDPIIARIHNRMKKLTLSAANALGVVAAGFGFGALLIFLASLFAFGKERSAELWSLYRSEFLIVGCLLLPAAGGKWMFLPLLLLLEGRGQFELFDLFGEHRIGVTLGTAMIAGLALVAVGIVAPVTFAPALVAAIAIVLAAGLVAERSFTAKRVWLSVSSLLFPTLLVAALGIVRAFHDGFAWLFLAYVTVEMNDAFALVTGKLIGRHLVLPRLSPKKTWEGLFGGFAVGGISGFVAARYFMGVSPKTALLTVAAILASGFVGDLASSALKRWRGKKDFKPIAAFHGGVLDIYDSLLFAAPALLLLRAAAGF